MKTAGSDVPDCALSVFMAQRRIQYDVGDGFNKMYIALFLLDILALIGVLGSPIVLFLSLFLNDSPNANPALVGFLQLVLWLFPLTAALGGVMGLVAAKTRNIRHMAIWTVVAYSSPIALGLALVIALVREI